MNPKDWGSKSCVRREACLIEHRTRRVVVQDAVAVVVVEEVEEEGI
jgi:hypothetical protein